MNHSAGIFTSNLREIDFAFVNSHDKPTYTLKYQDDLTCVEAGGG